MFIRRQRKLILSEGKGDLPIEYLASMLKNLESLGFTVTPTLFTCLKTQSESDIGALLEELVPVLRNMVGAHVDYQPMYPNFPKQVMEASEAELYINALMHYLGATLGLRILPEYEKATRPADFQPLDLKPIDLGTEEEFQAMAKNLMAANTSISETDKTDVAWFIEHYAEDPTSVLPVELPYKENLTFVTALLLKHTKAADLVLYRYYKTATDILRLAVALSEGDVSLADSTKFKSFKRRERKLLLSLLDRLDNPLEDMQRYRERWKRLGERLHPGEYRDKCPKAAKAFDVVRSKEMIETFGSKVERCLSESDAMKALNLLRRRPAELARRLDQLLRLDGSAHPAIIDAFQSAAPKVATPVLLQVMAHFEHRQEREDYRFAFPKGNAARLMVFKDTRPEIEASTTESVAKICRATLETRMKDLPSLGKTYIDPELKNYLVPFSQRSASKALRTLVRGSSIKLPPGDTLRFFLWWKEGEVNGEHTGTVDVDLSATMYDASWLYKEHISYTNLKSDHYRSYHSGDITSAPNGACEFIDIDMPSIEKYGGRFVVMQVYSFNGQPFSVMPECFGGWMIRKEPDSGEIFEAETVLDRLDLASSTKTSIPVVIDVMERRLIWTDLGISCASHSGQVNNLESNAKSVTALGMAMTALVKPTLFDLFSIHVASRGTLTDTPEEADTIFGIKDGLTPYDIETIIADYLI